MHYYLELVFLSLHSQAQISNVHITGTMRIEIASKNPITIENMKNGLENCLYGGYANDEAYKTNSGNQGFIVHGDVNEFITLVL